MTDLAVASGFFAKHAREYEENNLAVFPLRDKRPVVKNPQSFGRSSWRMLSSGLLEARGLGMWCGKRNGITVVDFDTHDRGVMDEFIRRAGDTPIKVANYPVFDAAGNLYVSDSGGWRENSGWICKIAPGGEGEVWSRDLSEFPNGTAMDAAGAYLYVAMSTDPGIARIKINEDGSAGAAEMLVALPETVPDGLAFDTEGTVYCSCYRPDRIYQYTADGQLDILADDYAGTAIAAPTNIAFCGPERDLFLSANLGRWHISKYDLGKIGVALNYPEVS